MSSTPESRVHSETECEESSSDESGHNIEAQSDSDTNNNNGSLPIELVSNENIRVIVNDDCVLQLTSDEETSRKELLSLFLRRSDDSNLDAADTSTSSVVYIHNSCKENDSPCGSNKSSEASGSCWTQTLPSLQLAETCKNVNRNFIQLANRLANRVNKIELLGNNEYVLSELFGDSSIASLYTPNIEEKIKPFSFNSSDLDLYYHLLKEDPNYEIKRNSINPDQACCSSSSPSSSSFVSHPDSTTINWKTFWGDCDSIKTFRFVPLKPVTLDAKDTVRVIKEISEELIQQPSAITCNEKMILSKQNFLKAVNNYLSSSLTTMLQSIEESLEECVNRLSIDVSKKVMDFNITAEGDKAQNILDDIICEWYKIINNLTNNVIAILEEGLKFSTIRLFLLPGSCNQAKFIKFFKVVIKLLSKLYEIYTEIESIVVPNVPTCDKSDLIKSEDGTNIEETEESRSANLAALDKLLYDEYDKELLMKPSVSYSNYSTRNNQSVETHQSKPTSSYAKIQELHNNNESALISDSDDSDELIFYIEDIN